MADVPKGRDPERTEKEDREPVRREHVEPADPEWVLERIQQTFDTPRD